MYDKLLLLSLNEIYGMHITKQSKRSFKISAHYQEHKVLYQQL